VQTLAQIKQLLAERGLSPRKSLGQNFLIDQNLIRKLVDAAGVGAGSLVLEVGPGTGTLTEELLARGCDIVASELDEGLADLLQERFGGEARFRLVRGDCLASKHELSADVVEALGGRGFVLAANLPYSVATPLMMTLLVDHPRCGGMFVTIQREVADRLLAGPGGKEYGPLAVVAGALCRVERVAVLPPECFWPRPEVHSAMVSLSRLAEPLTDDPAGLARVCRELFARRRKQIGGVLGKDFPWPAGVQPRMRAEELTAEQFVALSRVGRRG
jgi:16S rRNA (adenine1518-N6/adenine1519-N6)-dimethyltransferase